MAGRRLPTGRPCYSRISYLHTLPARYARGNSNMDRSLRAGGGLMRQAFGAARGGAAGPSAARMVAGGFSGGALSFSGKVAVGGARGFATARSGGSALGGVWGASAVTRGHAVGAIAGARGMASDGAPPSGLGPDDPDVRLTHGVEVPEDGDGAAEEDGADAEMKATASALEEEGGGEEEGDGEDEGDGEEEGDGEVDQDEDEEEGEDEEEEEEDTLFKDVGPKPKLDKRLGPDDPHPDKRFIKVKEIPEMDAEYKRQGRSAGPSYP